MCAVAAAPRAAGVRVWQLTSRRLGPRGGQPLPEGPSVDYPPCLDGCPCPRFGEPLQLPQPPGVAPSQ